MLSVPEDLEGLEGGVKSQEGEEMPLVFMQEGRDAPLALFSYVVKVEMRRKERASSLNLLANDPLLGFHLQVRVKREKGISTFLRLMK